MNNLKRLLLLWLCCSYLLGAGTCWAYEQQAKMVLVPLQDLIELQQSIQTQKHLLGLLKKELAEQGSTSTEQLALLQEQEKQLQELQTELDAARLDLNTARSSATKLQAKLDEQNDLLAGLSKAQKKQAAQQRLSNVRSFLYGAAVAYAAGRLTRN